MEAFGNTPSQQQTVDPEFQVLLHAVASCSGIAVQQLLRQNPSLVNKRGWHGQSALHKACLSGDTGVVGLVLESGADPNALNDFQETAVHYAAKRGIPTIVHLLVRYGGKLDLKDAAGKTPVHNAAETGSVYMLKYFEEQGLAFKDIDSKGFTPLHYTCQYGHLDAFKFLLRKGRSDPSQPTNEGDTALHICVREGYAHGSWLLVNYLGISCLDITNNLGLTPYDICTQYSSSNKSGHKQLLPMLEELSKLPKNSKITGPVKSWYLNLTTPFLVYALAVLLCNNVILDYQGPVFMLAVALIVYRGYNSSHRLPHISRWANPFYTGCFAAGLVHTMLYYYWIIGNPVEKQLLLLCCVLANIIQVYLYYKLLKSDAGLVSSGVVNEKTGQPVKLTDLCEEKAPLDTFCSVCEIVRTKMTKHCLLCDRCYYRMDHHCLFLLNCVGFNNHARFVWFIIITLFVMTVFVWQCALYVVAKYISRELTYTEIAVEMFWTDCWLMSIVALNIISMIWAVNLVHYQLKVVSRGHTTYFQKNISLLTSTEKLTNIIHFLQGKAPYATGFDFNTTTNKACCDNQMKRDVHLRHFEV